MVYNREWSIMAVEEPAGLIFDHLNPADEHIGNGQVDLLSTWILAKRGNTKRSEYQTVSRGLGADLFSIAACVKN